MSLDMLGGGGGMPSLTTSMGDPTYPTMSMYQVYIQIKIDRQVYSKAEIQKERQIDMNVDRMTDRKKDRQTLRQIEWLINRH